MSARSNLTAALRELLVQQRRQEAQLTRVVDERENLAATSTKVGRYLTLHQQEQALKDSLDTLRDQIVETAARLAEVLE